MRHSRNFMQWGEEKKIGNKWAFLVNDQYFLFNSQSLQVSRITAKEFFNLKLGVEKKQDENIGFLDELMAWKNEDLPDVNSVYLLVTSKCNLNCKYCYEKTKYRIDIKHNMSPEIALKGLNFLIKNSSKKDVNICFFGGEPLINFELVEKTVSYALRNLQTENKKIHFSIVTNGILLTRRIADFLKTNKFEIRVSIDGNETFENIKYVDKKALDHKPLILSSILLLDKFSVNSVIMDKNSDILKLRKLLSPYPIKKHYLYLPISRDRKDDFLKNLENLVFQFLRSLSLYARDIVEMNYWEDPILLGYFGGIFTKLSKRLISLFSCSFGGSECVIAPDGTVYPCPAFVNEPLFKIGHVNTGLDKDKLKKIWAKHFSYRKEKCVKCPIKYICLGGCLAENMDNDGKYIGPMQIMCSLRKNVFKIGVYLWFNKKRSKGG